MLLIFAISMFTGIIKTPELQRFFLPVYDFISAARLSLLHDYSGLALVVLIIIHLVIKRDWLAKHLSAKLSFSNQLRKIVYAFVALIFLIFIIIYINARYFAVRAPINLSSVEIKEYQGEKLGSIEDFRENSIKGVQYANKDSYELAISGLAANPVKLKYDEILELPEYQKVVILNCVEGWSVKALWTGVLVKDILAEIDIKPEAKIIIFYAQDGYSTSFPLDYVLENDIIMASKLNDVVLPPERGFPFQLVAEQKWGYKWIKWITRIELSDDMNYEGFWESRGYNNNGDYSGSKYAN